MSRRARRQIGRSADPVGADDPAGPDDSAQRPAGHALCATVADFLSRRLAAGDRLCVGLSGGRDSVVLLHALASLWAEAFLGGRWQLSAVHVEHGLSEHAAAWAAFCRDLCARLDVPLRVARVEVPRAGGEGLEAAARRARYGVFADCPADWLALAHQRDDQAETVLFRLLRGAGVAGVAGMRSERAQPGGPRLIRPLLDLPRSALADYAAANSLAWVEDESNADCRFRRNFLRREILPRLTTVFPGAAPALARAAAHFAEAQQLLAELAQADRQRVAVSGGRIDLAAFQGLSPARARNLLRCELAAAGWRSPDARWLDEAQRQLADSSAGAQPCLTTVDGELRVHRGLLHVLSGPLPAPPPAVRWLGERQIAWGERLVTFRPVVGAGLSRRRLAGLAVWLRPRQGGERLQPDARRPRRALSNLLQEAGVPPWERRRLPLLWAGDDLVWVGGGIGCAADFACAAGEEGLLVAEEGGATWPAGAGGRARAAAAPGAAGAAGAAGSRPPAVDRSLGQGKELI